MDIEELTSFISRPVIPSTSALSAPFAILKPWAAVCDSLYELDAVEVCMADRAQVGRAIIFGATRLQREANVLHRKVERDAVVNDSVNKGAGHRFSC